MGSLEELTQPINSSSDTACQEITEQMCRCRRPITDGSQAVVRKVKRTECRMVDVKVRRGRQKKNRQNGERTKLSTNKSLRLRDELKYLDVKLFGSGSSHSSSANHAKYKNVSCYS